MKLEKVNRFNITSCACFNLKIQNYFLQAPCPVPYTHSYHSIFALHISLLILIKQLNGYLAPVTGQWVTKGQLHPPFTIWIFITIQFKFRVLQLRTGCESFVQFDSFISSCLRPALF